MKARPGLVVLLVATALSRPIADPAPPAPANQFRLKPGAQGTLCLTCHSEFKDVLKLPFVHRPVQTGDCVRCHNPHAASHGKLLSSEPGDLCAHCHVSMTAEKIAANRSVHPPVTARECVKCHDPHGARNKGQLPVAGNQLCVSCHAELQKAAAAAKFKHPPVEKNCLGCHDPHSSKDAPHLLIKPVPALCITCHRVDAPVFAKQHLNYPVGKGDCTSCHDPHGSDQGGMLWSTVHPPVINKMCSQCHQDASSPRALSTKRTGVDLCRGCHAAFVNGVFTKNRLHWPIADRRACLNCHNPHASRQPKLLGKPLVSLCGSCHEGAVRTIETSAVKHPPAAQGECATCHEPHSSNAQFLFTSENELTLCATCHDYQKHSNHPFGGTKSDPRNANVLLDCSSCHAPHASPFKAFAYQNPESDLCVQCHEQLRR